MGVTTEGGIDYRKIKLDDDKYAIVLYHLATNTPLGFFYKKNTYIGDDFAIYQWQVDDAVYPIALLHCFTLRMQVL
jgi:hypothetical protein